MLTGTHHSTRALAEAALAASDFTEIAVDTWLSDCGRHVATLRPMQVVAIDVAPALVAVSVDPVVAK